MEKDSEIEKQENVKLEKLTSLAKLSFVCANVANI